MLQEVGTGTDRRGCWPALSLGSAAGERQEAHTAPEKDPVPGQSCLASFSAPQSSRGRAWPPQATFSAQLFGSGHWRPRSPSCHCHRNEQPCAALQSQLWSPSSCLLRLATSLPLGVLPRVPLVPSPCLSQPPQPEEREGGVCWSS